MTDSNAKDEPELIVDEDWKEQVQKEKEALRAADAKKAAEAAAAEAAAGEAAAGEVAAGEVAAGGDQDAGGADVTADAEAAADQLPPPASFVTLVSMLFTQAMAMMGQIPDPTTGKPSVNKPIAKHYIDTLEMLETKTKGNLDDEEGKMIGEALHALRMTYVAVKA